VIEWATSKDDTEAFTDYEEDFGRLYDLAKELFVAEGGHQPPHRCINNALLFIEEWRAFLGMDSARPSKEGSGNPQGEP